MLWPHGRPWVYINFAINSSVLNSGVWKHFLKAFQFILSSVKVVILSLQELD